VPRVGASLSLSTKGLQRGCRLARTRAGAHGARTKISGVDYLIVSPDHLPSNRDGPFEMLATKLRSNAFSGPKAPEATSLRVICRLHHTQRKRPRCRQDGIAASPRRHTMRLRKTGGLAWKVSGGCISGMAPDGAPSGPDDASRQALPHSCGTAPACARMAVTGLHPVPSPRRSGQGQRLQARVSAPTISARDTRRLDKQKNRRSQAHADAVTSTARGSRTCKSAGRTNAGCLRIGLERKTASQMDHLTLLIRMLHCILPGCTFKTKQGFDRGLDQHKQR